MSVKLSAWVWDGCAAAGIKGTKLLIMLRLADYASDEGIAYPGIATIARQLGAGRSTVISLIGELEKGGWLMKKERRQGQRSTSNLYTLNVAKLRQAADASYSQGPKAEHPKSERPEIEENDGSQGPESGQDPSVKSTPDPSDKKNSCQVAPPPDPEVLITDRAKNVLTHLNKTTGTRFQVCKTSMENIRARLGEGFTQDELMLVVDYSVEKWANNLEMSGYLRPTTLFKPSKFPGYLQSATKWHAAGRPDRRSWGKAKSAVVSANLTPDVGIDVAERDRAWLRYHGMTENNDARSDAENEVREKASRSRLRLKKHTDGLAKFGWDNIWSVVAQNARRD